jgi:hypothetical protein
MEIGPPSFGIELEFFLLDDDDLPAIGATQRVTDRWFLHGWDHPPVPELSSFQIELNPGPWPLTPTGLEAALNYIRDDGFGATGGGVVTFPPGRARLSIRPCCKGAPAGAMTIGIVRVAAMAALVAGVKWATMTSTPDRTNAAANSMARSPRPSV